MTNRPIGIISALVEELALFRAATKITSEQTIGGFRFEMGTLHDKPVVLAQSVPGKVNAASLATLFATEFNVRALLFSGVAGGINPAHAVLDVIIAERVIQHDYGAIANQKITTYRPGATTIGPVVDPIDYCIPDRLKAQLSEIDGAKLGTILTGDLFINCIATRERLAAEFGGDAVEMEGGAVAQIADRFGIDWLIVRALSDLAGESDADIDFRKFLQQAADKAASVALQIFERL